MGNTSTILCLLFKGNHKNETTTAMCNAPRNIVAIAPRKSRRKKNRLPNPGRERTGVNDVVLSQSSSIDRKAEDPMSGS